MEDFFDGCVRSAESLKAVARVFGLQKIAEFPIVQALSDMLPCEAVVETGAAQCGSFSLARRVRSNLECRR